MADTLELELIDFDTIKNQYPYWNQHCELCRELYSKGREPIIVTGKLIADTLNAALHEPCDPANDILNFTTPQQVYIRSSQAADTDLSYYVIGQKADGSFGKFTLTTDDTDGTTPVDCGTWKVIFGMTGTGDVATGNIIIDDDGASTTVFFTAALGANPKTGIIHVPEGYYGAVPNIHLKQTDVPTTVASDAVFFTVGDAHVSIVPYGQSGDKGGKHMQKPVDEKEQILLQGRFDTAVILCELHFTIIFWTKPSNA